MKRQTKELAGKTLLAEEIKQLSRILTTEPENIYFDKEKKNILYTFAGASAADSRINKIAVEVNYNTKKGTRNTISTTGKVLESEPARPDKHEKIK